MKFIVYDFEIFKKDWLVVFKKGDETTVIHNDRDLLQEYYDLNINNIFVGFNNKHFDDYILKGILKGLDAKRISDFIIVKRKQGWEYPGIGFMKLNSLDVKQDLVGGLSLSLKESEGNMGMNIEETEVDFNITRALTEEELKSTIKYCKHDVLSTEKILEKRFKDVSVRMEILKMFNLSIDNIGKTNAKLTATILKSNRRSRDDELFYNVPDNLKVENKEILNLYSYGLDYNDKLKIDINNVEHVLAYGGLHGAKRGIFDGNIYYADVGLITWSN